MSNADDEGAPEALLALATYLEGMVAGDQPGQPRVVRVAARKKRDR